MGKKKREKARKKRRAKELRLRGKTTIRLLDEIGQPVVTGKPIPKGTVIGFAGVPGYWKVT